MARLLPGQHLQLDAVQAQHVKAPGQDKAGYLTA